MAPPPHAFGDLWKVGATCITSKYCVTAVQLCMAQRRKCAWQMQGGLSGRAA